MSYTAEKEVTQPAYDADGVLIYQPGDRVSADTDLSSDIRWRYVFTAYDPEPTA